MDVARVKMRRSDQEAAGILDEAFTPLRSLSTSDDIIF